MYYIQHIREKVLLAKSIISVIGNITVHMLYEGLYMWQRHVCAVSLLCMQCVPICAVLARELIRVFIFYRGSFYLDSFSFRRG
jgi:hypothetical protein